MKNKINELIYHLNGTNMSLEEGCADLGINFEELTIEELAEIDNWIFQCDGCGWWCDAGEKAWNNAAIGNFCQDCLEEGYF